MGLTDRLTMPISQDALALLHGMEAHGAYWESSQVAQKIVQAIEKAVIPPSFLSSSQSAKES
jgi:hypothetical protein